MFRVLIGAAAMILVGASAEAEPVLLHAAGSLKAALGEVADAFTQDHGIEVERSFGASGLLRGRIEGGETAQVFASANMEHPQILADAGQAGPVVLFARNQLCALAGGDVEVETGELLDRMLDPSIRVGTSTPKADPSGDYAWESFVRAEAVRPGARETLEGKAMALTGGPDSPRAPEGRNTYAWVMDEGQADIFLTYCTNAVIAQREVPSLQIITLPKELAVGADYGLTVLSDAPEEAWRLAFYILSPKGQQILADYGFDAPSMTEITTAEAQ